MSVLATYKVQGQTACHEALSQNKRNTESSKDGDFMDCHPAGTPIGRLTRLLIGSAMDPKGLAFNLHLIL